MNKLKVIWEIIKSENYIVIVTDKTLSQKSFLKGIGNTLYKMTELFNFTYLSLLKDNKHKF